MDLKLFIHPKVKIKILLSQILAIIPFLIFIFILIDLWYDARRTLILEQNLSNAQILESYITDTINHSRGIALTLGQQDIYAVLQKSGYLSDKEKMKIVLKRIQERQPELHSISLFDPGGNLIETSFDYPPERAGTNISDRDYFQMAVNEKKTVISNPLIGRLSKEYIVIVATPILIEDHIEGVFLVNFNLNHLKKDLEEAVKGQNRRIFLIDSSGNIIKREVIIKGMLDKGEKKKLDETIEKTGEKMAGYIRKAFELIEKRIREISGDLEVKRGNL